MPSDTPPRRLRAYRFTINLTHHQHEVNENCIVARETQRSRSVFPRERGWPDGRVVPHGGACVFPRERG